MNIKTAITKELDQLLGPLFVHIFCLFLNAKDNSHSVFIPSSVLLIRPGGIGDAVLLIPAIKAIKKRLPDGVLGSHLHISFNV